MRSYGILARPGAARKFVGLDGLHAAARRRSTSHVEVVEFRVREYGVDRRPARASVAEHLARLRANPVLQQGRIDRAFVDIEQGHVVVQRLVQQDDELDEVGVRLLPERLFALAEQVVQQRGDAVRQRVRVEIVVQRVVAKLRRRG